MNQICSDFSPVLEVGHVALEGDNTRLAQLHRIFTQKLREDLCRKVMFLFQKKIQRKSCPNGRSVKLSPDLHHLLHPSGQRHQRTHLEAKQGGDQFDQSFPTVAKNSGKLLFRSLSCRRKARNVAPATGPNDPQTSMTMMLSMSASGNWLEVSVWK